MTKNYKEEISHYSFKQAHIYPKLELFQTKKAYALTISPMHHYSAYIEQYNDFEEHIKPLLVGHIQLRPELSTKSVEWHWHGTIYFTETLDIVKFYKNIVQLKHLCTFAIKSIVLDWEWHLYCIKQRHLIKPYINAVYNRSRLRIPYNLKFTSHESPDNGIFYKKEGQQDQSDGRGQVLIKTTRSQARAKRVTTHTDVVDMKEK